MLIQPVILCGGSGTRLWPVSTPEKPKPFLQLLGERTLFQQALDRVADRSLFATPLVVAGEAHRQWVAEQAGNHALIVEPCARNTAPAIALAAARLDPETLMLACPSDHYIADESAFRDAVHTASELAADGNLVSLGIEPDRPETGYGYIERGEVLGAGHRTARFVEKPDEATAAAYLADGNFVWNAGIFVFRAGQLLDELAQFRPEMAELVRSAVEEGREKGDTFLPAEASFSAIAAESIDYALMENTRHAAVVTADMGWSDIGSWKALMDAHESKGGAASGNARLVDCKRVMVRSNGPRVSALGLEDVIIVVEGDEVLVVARDAAEKIGSLAGDESR
ncbi:NTP transferase domain-containing protein [Qipengyuania sp. 1NDH17]|uniref:NTP transferase domain-containing protein n=1 Tax=Qipengyuania polymorpha TaxID=2867234 RepID=A0ABS7IXK9_9SPHN|nr:sugar phosphate nucleotidyltransferase [Qipengyuania polymorpha]MBX7458296.1 NTP transferase domain-containing protein [Qipengyuania polymorpha]